MDISIDQAKALCAVVKNGGYTKAAVSLNKSHSALIYLIKNLENQCGFPIFNRSSYRNELTSAGKRIHLKCQELIGKVEEIQILCSDIHMGWEPHLRIVLDGILPIDTYLKFYKQIRFQKASTTVHTYTDFLFGVEKTFNLIEAEIMI